MDHPFLGAKLLYNFVFLFNVRPCNLFKVVIFLISNISLVYLQFDCPSVRLSVCLSVCQSSILKKK